MPFHARHQGGNADFDYPVLVPSVSVAGINDPTTALYCIDRLGEVLGRLASRDIPAPMRLDETGQLRVATEVVLLQDVACRAFAAVARYGIIDPDVVNRLVETLTNLETSVTPAARIAIAEFRVQVVSTSQRTDILEFDRKILLKLYPSPNSSNGKT